jgi:hypothetical protein
VILTVVPGVADAVGAAGVAQAPISETREISEASRIRRFMKILVVVT